MSKKVYLCNWICVRCIRCNMRRFGGLRLRPWIGVRVDLGFCSQKSSRNSVLGT